MCARIRIVRVFLIDRLVRVQPPQERARYSYAQHGPGCGPPALSLALFPSHVQPTCACSHGASTHPHQTKLKRIPIKDIMWPSAALTPRASLLVRAWAAATQHRAAPIGACVCASHTQHIIRARYARTLVPRSLPPSSSLPRPRAPIQAWAQPVRPPGRAGCAAVRGTSALG